jgi:acetylornithine deacetylase/succinyl-diaminopimelate desuccinylase-like protein
MQNLKFSASELLLKLISFDTQNSNKSLNIQSTDAALDFISLVLRENGINCEFQEYLVSENKVKRKNLIAFLNGGKDLPRIGFEGHIDTVPFGDYNNKPLGYRENGKIYGRGAVDMKGSLAGMITAMINAKNSGRKLKAEPVLIITSDEEANEFAGIKNYLKRNDNLSFVICGEPSNFVVEDRFKGALHSRITITGKSGHGSRQHEGENAIIKGMPILRELEKLYLEVQDITNELFRSKDPYSHRSSMNPGIIIAGGEAVNVIPDKMRIEFEMRLVRPFAEYERILKNRISEDLQFVFFYDPIVANLSSIENKINQLGKERGVGIGFSEANLINNAGIVSIVYGVGNKSMCHSNEEFIEESDLDKYTQNLFQLLI